MVLKDKWNDIVARDWAAKGRLQRWNKKLRHGLSEAKSKGFGQATMDFVSEPRFMRNFLLPLLVLFVLLLWAGFFWTYVPSLPAKIVFTAIIAAALGDIFLRLRRLLAEAS